MSLSVLNEGRDAARAVPGADRRAGARCGCASPPSSSTATRCCAPLYTALGTRIHLRQAGARPGALSPRALAEAGLTRRSPTPPTPTEYDEALRASHDAGMKPVGMDVGTPVIHVPGPGRRADRLLRPGRHPGPKGEAAGRLWDGVLLVAGTPGFFELKRTRDEGPIFD